MIEEEMREEVLESMNDDTILKGAQTQVLGSDDYFPCKGKLRTNQFLHKPPGQRVARNPDAWLRQGDLTEMWGDCHSEEPDDLAFPPDSKVEAAVVTLNNSSLTGNVSSWTGTTKFRALGVGAIYCQPDEQRWRSFLYGVIKATGQYRQVSQIRNSMAAFRRGSRSLQSVAQHIKRMVEIGDMANICDEMGKQNSLDLNIVPGKTLLDETAVSTLTNIMTEREGEALKRHNYTMRTTGNPLKQAVDLKQMLKWISAQKTLLGNSKGNEVSTESLSAVDLETITHYINRDRDEQMRALEDKDEQIASMTSGSTAADNSGRKRTRGGDQAETTTPTDPRQQKRPSWDESHDGETARALFGKPESESEIRKRVRFELVTERKQGRGRQTWTN